MIRKAYAAAILSLIVMIALPLCIVKFVPGVAGMALCFLLFYGLNPICSFYIGICAGRSPRTMWPTPVLNAAAFLVGAWMLFEMGEIAFWIMAAIYLAIGAVTMGISALVCRWRARI